MTKSSLSVRTHVARDLLQSAALFKTDRLVVWEYVSNGLQYAKPGQNPVVQVTVDAENKVIIVRDNGRGMDLDALQHFLTMHGENLDRRRGAAGRGRFGTGKCAAFGIADCLEVSSIRDGRRNTVRLTRKEIEKAGGDQIPVTTVEHEVLTQEADGTTITISSIRVRKIDERGIVRYLERHLSRWPGKPFVSVNEYVCEFAEPPIAQSEVFIAAECGFTELGNAKLTINVSRQPLEADQQGVSIFSRGVWLETTLAGAEGQHLSQYIFGSIDVPELDDETEAVAAFDMSRSMQLNRENILVQRVLAFIGLEVDRMRRRLVKEDNERKDQEEMRRLANEARHIAELINDDFGEFSDRVARVTSKSGKGKDVSEKHEPAAVFSAGDDLLTMGGETLGTPIPTVAGKKQETDSVGEKTADPSKKTLEQNAMGADAGTPANLSRRPAKRKGGFRVEFRQMGIDARRAVYVSEERTIFINLDHPQIVAVKGGLSIEAPLFRKISYEVAFSEYSVALASELAQNGQYIEPSDPIFDVRETIDRMARRAAALYAI